MVPRLKTFYLSVLVPIAAGGHCVHVFSIEHGAGLQWTREHADELATMAYGPGYDALMVHESDPYPVTPAAPAPAVDAPMHAPFRGGPGPCPTCPHGRGFHCRTCWPA